nr:glycosyltransferase family 2 protein [Desulfobacter latus]
MENGNYVCSVRKSPFLDMRAEKKLFSIIEEKNKFKNPSIAIIIVNWNSGKWLKKCLHGIAQQTLKPYRVILVDNASTDNSLVGVDRILNGLEVVCLENNTGFACANNIAINMLHDIEWVALLNPDAVAEAHWLENLYSAAKKHNEYHFFASQMRDAEKPWLLDGMSDVYHVTGYAWRKGHGSPILSVPQKCEECFSPCAAAAMYKTDALIKAGGFDEQFFCYFEDVDLGFRLQLFGYRCLYVSNAVVFHAGSATTGKRSSFSVYYGHRNMVWAFMKNMPWPLLGIFLPYHIIMNIVAVCLLSFRGQGKVVLKAKYDAFKNIGQMWAKRKQTQIERKVSNRVILSRIAKGILPLIRRD